MKFVVNTESLHTAMKAASRALAGRAITPVMNNVLFEAKDDKLTITCTNLDTTIIVNCEIKEVIEGSVTVPCKKMLEILAKLPPGSDMKIGVHAETKVLKIQSGKVKFDLFTIAADQFPKYTNIRDAVKPINYDRSKFINGLKKTACCVGINTQIVITGINFCITPEYHGFAATDGFKMSIMDYLESHVNVSANIIIPYKTVTDILGLFNNDSSLIRISIDGTILEVKDNSTTVIANLIPEKFPAIRSFIKKDGYNYAKVNRKELIKCLEFMSLAVTSDNYDKVWFTFCHNNLKLFTNDKSIGASDVEMDVEYDCDKLAITVNYKLFLGILRALDDDYIKIGLLGPKNVILIAIDSEPGYCGVIAPTEVA